MGLLEAGSTNWNQMISIPTESRRVKGTYKEEQVHVRTANDFLPRFGTKSYGKTRAWEHENMGKTTHHTDKASRETLNEARMVPKTKVPMGTKATKYAVKMAGKTPKAKFPMGVKAGVHAVRQARMAPKIKAPADPNYRGALAGPNKAMARQQSWNVPIGRIPNTRGSSRGRGR